MAHWQAATLICSGLCGMDSFFYFLAWLIGQGRSVFTSVAASPDALADVPQVRRLALIGGVDADWPDGEALYRVPVAGVRGRARRRPGHVPAVAGAGAGV